jgi:hypothetical protein
MTRFASNSMQYLSTLPRVAYRILADIGVTSGYIYACTGNKVIVNSGNTYTPVGALGGVDAIQEESDPFPRDLRLWLAAITSSNLYEPLRESMFGRTVTLYRVFLNDETYTVSAPPEQMYKGKINEIELRFNDSERGNYYEITCVNEVRREPIVAYSNKETLQLTYSGDTFCDFQHIIPTFKSMWGQQPTRYLGGTLVTPLQNTNNLGRFRGR